MEREWLIRGKGLTEEYRDGIEGYFGTMAENATTTIKGELEKTPEDIKILEAIDSYIHQEFSDLGIPNYQPFSPDQFHIFAKRQYKKKFPDSPNAFREKLSDAVMVNRDAWSRTERYITLIHEALEFQAYRQYDANVEAMRISEYRTGYMVSPPQELEHDHFNGFHDTVVEKYARELFERHKEEIIGINGIAEIQNESKQEDKYLLDIDILETVISDIAGKQNLSYESVWNEIKKGLFTGQLAHLRKVEQTFGKGSLRVLGAWNSGTIRISEDKRDEKFLEFFQIPDDTQRSKVILPVLNERERFRYLNRHK